MSWVRMFPTPRLHLTTVLKLYSSKLGPPPGDDLPQGVIVKPFGKTPSRLTAVPSRPFQTDRGHLSTYWSPFLLHNRACLAYLGTPPKWCDYACP